MWETLDFDLFTEVDDYNEAVEAANATIDFFNFLKSDAIIED